MRSLIYYSEDKMEVLKGVFNKISGCKSCKLRENSFSVDSSQIITNPSSDEEAIFNNLQRKAFFLGYNRVIFSFTI